MTPLIDKLRDDTYNNTKQILSQTHKCVIIRPTGYGKTGILTRFIHDYDSVLYLYPTEIVKTTVLSFYFNGTENIPDDEIIDNVTFMTYNKLASLTIKDIKNLPKFACIILDECHRVGALKTCRKLDKLLEIQGQGHIFDLIGATATPDRMDCVDEISRYFEDYHCDYYTLHDAFQDRILKRPYYLFCKYADTTNLPKHISQLTKSELKRLTVNTKDIQLRNDLNARLIEFANIFNMENVIRNTCDKYVANNTYMKFIVFFSSFATIKDNGPKVAKWFHDAYPTHTCETITITSESKQTQRNIRKLTTLTTRPNHIDLIFTCDMMNMGYHVDNLTGIVMYRGTKSGTVYMQQLGRVLSSGASNAGIVFDIVDNIHQHSVYRVLNKESTYTTNARKRLFYLQDKKKKHQENPKFAFSLMDEAELAGLQRRFKNPTQTLNFIKSNNLQKEDLLAIDYDATYKDIIAKTVAESKSMRCRQAWARWMEVRAQENLPFDKNGRPFTRQEIINMLPPEDIPLPPFCYAKSVSVEAVLDEMQII